MPQIDVISLQPREYKDFSLSMRLNPVTNDVVAVTGVDAVKRSIKNLILTYAGEVPFFPNFGSRLHRLLFEPLDAITFTLLDAEIRSTIAAYEPRVTVLSLDLSEPEDNKLQVDLTLRLVNLVEPITLTVFLTRLR